MEKDKDKFIDIWVLQVNKFEKKQKASMNYIIPQETSNYSKGGDVTTQWFEGSKAMTLFDNINFPEDGEPQHFLAHFCYARQFNGSFKMNITDICSLDGQVLLEF